MSVILAASARRRSRSRGPVNLVVDGNSISTAAYSQIGTFDKHIVQHEPWLSIDQLTHSCWAVSGETWLDMLNEHSVNVDAAWVDGATNVLVTWETRNSIVTGLGVTATLDYIRQYTAGRRALHPGWRILYVETIPTGGSGTYATINARMSEVDAAVRADPAYYGFDATVYLRTIPGFDHDGTTPEPFQAYLHYWHEKDGGYTHPEDPGKNALSPTISAAAAALLP